MTHISKRSARRACRPGSLVIPVVLAAGCGKKDSGEDTGTVTSGTSDSTAGSAVKTRDNAAVDKATMAALDRMGSYVRSLKDDP